MFFIHTEKNLVIKWMIPERIFLVGIDNEINYFNNHLLTQNRSGLGDGNDNSLQGVTHHDTNYWTDRVHMGGGIGTDEHCLHTGDIQPTLALQVKLDGLCQLLCAGY